MQSPVGNAKYAYDADGIRVRSVANSVVTNYIVDKNRAYAQVFEEKDDAGSLIVSYVYGDNLISQKRGSSVSYYHYDGIGSTRALTDGVANVTDTYIYEAFGNLLTSSGFTENNYLFTGEQYDPNIGFYYLRTRYYNPGNGRFVTQDPFRGYSLRPVSLNKYPYAEANPVTHIDPGGTMSLVYQMAVIGIMADLGYKSLSVNNKSCKVQSVSCNWIITTKGLEQNNSDNLMTDYF